MSMLSKLKDVFSYAENGQAEDLRHIAIIVEEKESDSGPSAAFCGVADLILRIEAASRNVYGSSVRVMSVGTTGFPVICSPGSVGLKVEVSAKCEPDMNYLLDLIDEESRVIAEARNLSIRRADMDGPAEEVPAVGADAVPKPFGWHG